MGRLPLEGIRIINLGIVWAGPYGAMLLCDMGAEVIRIDALQQRDFTRPSPVSSLLPKTVLAGLPGAAFPDRDPGERPWDRGSTFNYGLRGNLSMTVDLRRPEGRDIFLRLAKISDVVYENGVQVMAKLGLTYDVIKEANPQIIMLSFPGYGIEGPYKHFKGYGANVEALVGHTWLRGYPDSDPTETSSIYHGDPAAGASAAFALLSALYHRRKTGEGQFIDMAQSENVIHHLSQAVMDFSMNGRVQGTMGNRDPSRAPQGAYRCQGNDSWIAISVGSDAEFVALCRAMGQPELAGDPRFADVVSRYHNQDALDQIISAWTQQGEHYALFQRLQREGVIAGPILTHAEVLQDPHMEARGFFEVVTHPVAGTHPHAGPAFDFSNTPLHIRGPAPSLGQHNEYVYKQLLGYSDAEYAHLVEEKHIGDAYLPGVV